MRRIYIILLFCLLFINVSSPIHAEETYANNAKGAYVMEYSTKKEVFNKNATVKLYPASMTKMMGLILIYEAINQHQLSLNDTVKVSSYASSMGGSQIYLEENEVMDVHDLIKSICIASANDAMVAIAEKIAGSEMSFVNKMNEMVKELKLENTHFENATGLHHENHYSCAKDMAIVAHKLLEVGGNNLLNITSTYEDYIREESDEPFWLVNTNKLIKQYEGVDGLKTGFTSQALSCICVTAKKEDIRFIVVVMGEPNSKIRNKEVIELLDHSFSLFEKRRFYNKGTIIDDYHLEDAKAEKIELVCEENVDLIYKKGDKIEISSQEIEWLNKELPYKKGERVAKLKLQLTNGDINTSYLIVHKNIDKKTYLDIVKNILLKFF